MFCLLDEELYLPYTIQFKLAMYLKKIELVNEELMRKYVDYEEVSIITTFDTTFVHNCGQKGEYGLLVISVLQLNLFIFIFCRNFRSCFFYLFFKTTKNK